MGVFQRFGIGVLVALAVAALPAKASSADADISFNLFISPGPPPFSINLTTPPEGIFLAEASADDGSQILRRFAPITAAVSLPIFTSTVAFAGTFEASTFVNVDDGSFGRATATTSETGDMIVGGSLPVNVTFGATVHATQSGKAHTDFSLTGASLGDLSFQGPGDQTLSSSLLLQPGTYPFSVALEADSSVSAIPEPATFAETLTGIGLLAIFACRTRPHS
jgi:hypothetical protein